MAIKNELIKILGSEYVTDDQKVLENYSRDYSLTSPGMASFVVYPGRTEDVQRIVKLCNDYSIPVVPCSSRVHFRGCTIPRQGGIVLDLRRMNRILSINERNRYVMLEPGVTWGEIQTRLEGLDLMVCPPLLPHPEQSVITSFLEREPLVISLYEYNEPLMSMEVVWPDGSIFRTGSASAPNFPDTFVEGTNPMGPGTLDFFRLLQGAQGTMGIVTWAMVKTEYRSSKSKTFFICFDQIEKAIEPLYRIQRRKIGYECLLMDSLNLACIISRDGFKGIEALKESIPRWIIVLVLRGARRRPEEKFAYEEEALRETSADFPGMALGDSLPGISDSAEYMAKILRGPWLGGNPYWKHRYQGGCQEIFFITKMSRISEFYDMVISIAGRNDFSISKVGCYVQPIDNGRSCHMEFDLFYNPEDGKEIDRVNRLMNEASEVLWNHGALFTRPYGILSDIVYRRSADYTSVLRKVKSIFDPRNILNPGHLCF